MKKLFSKRHTLLTLSSLLLGVASTVSAMNTNNCDKKTVTLDTFGYADYLKLFWCKEQGDIQKQISFIKRHFPDNDVNKPITCGAFIGRDKITLIHTAVSSNKQNLVEHLLNHTNADVNATNSSLYDGLNREVTLVRQGSLPIDKRGITISPIPQGQTPLHSAIYEDNSKITELLINNKADITIKDEAGKTPLIIASERYAWHTWSAFENSRIEGNPQKVNFHKQQRNKQFHTIKLLTLHNSPLKESILEFPFKFTQRFLKRHIDSFPQTAPIITASFQPSEHGEKAQSIMKKITADLENALDRSLAEKAQKRSEKILFKLHQDDGSWASRFSPRVIRKIAAHTVKNRSACDEIRNHQRTHPVGSIPHIIIECQEFKGFHQQPLLTQ